MMNEELLNKAKATKSPEELLKLAQENGMPKFNEENAKVYFEALHHSGELADEELSVSAGACALRAHGQKMVSMYNTCNHYRCKVCNGGTNGFYPKKKDYYADEETLRNCSKNCSPYENDTLFGPPERSEICYECYYCSYERGAWWCNNKIHYNE